MSYPMMSGADAFPAGDDDSSGLSKRQLLAAMAMQGILSCGGTPPDQVASDAVWQADALIAEINRKPRS